MGVEITSQSGFEEIFDFLRDVLIPPRATQADIDEEGSLPEPVASAEASTATDIIT